MKLNLTNLRKIKTLDELEKLDIGPINVEVGHRGGHLGFRGEDVATAINVDASYLPKNYGAYCNYLGGGLRGAVCASGFDRAITGREAQLLNELAEACKRAYVNAEGPMNNEVDEDGEINWEAKGTNASRRAGIERAY